MPGGAKRSTGTQTPASSSTLAKSKSPAPISGEQGTKLKLDLPNGVSPEDLSPAVLQLMMQEEEARKNAELASWVDTQYTKCKNARSPFERQWYINLAFVSGKHYVSPVDVPGQGFRLTAPKAPPWRVRLVVNKIRTSVRVECSKLTSSKPIPTVLPSTNEDEDFSAARVAELILRSHFASTNFQNIYRSWIWWGVVCGTSYIKSYWDPNASDYDSMSNPQVPLGPPGPNGEPGQPIPQDMIDRIPQLKQYMDTPVPAVGKIQIERISPFHVFVPDLLAENIEDQPYVIQVMTRDPLWVERSFGFKPSCDSRSANTVMDAATIISKGSENHLDAVLVKEIWLKENAHPDFPDGGMMTICNGKIVQMAKKWPLPFREYPFYKYDGIPTGGYYADSSVVDLIPIQKEYNRTKSQMIEIKNTMGKPKIMYQKGSINPRMISSEPGQAIPYVAGYERPTVLPAAEIPNTMALELDRLSTDFDDISGQHEISRGGTPSQVTSGTAIAFLQEQDDTKLSYQVASIEHCAEMIGKHYLKYVAHFWDEPRIIKVTGKDNSYESMHWKGNDLKGNTDVKVQAGSALPTSKAAKQALITEFMSNGFLDPTTGMEILEMGGLEKAMDEVLVDKKQAQRENLKLSSAPEQLLTMLMNPAPGPNGEPPVSLPPDPTNPQAKPHQMNGDGTPFQPQPPVPVNSWDNHEAHVHFHNQYRKTQEFELLPDVVKKGFELHVQLHQMALTMNIVNTQGQVIQQNQPDPSQMPQGDPNAPPQETAPQEQGTGSPPA